MLHLARLFAAELHGDQAEGFYVKRAMVWGSVGRGLRDDFEIEDIRILTSSKSPTSQACSVFPTLSRRTWPKNQLTIPPNSIILSYPSLQDHPLQACILEYFLHFATLQICQEILYWRVRCLGLLREARVVHSLAHLST